MQKKKIEPVSGQGTIFSVKGGWEHSILFAEHHCLNFAYALASFTETETSSWPNQPHRSNKFLGNGWMVLRCFSPIYRISSTQSKKQIICDFESYFCVH